MRVVPITTERRRRPPEPYYGLIGGRVVRLQGPPRPRRASFFRVATVAFLAGFGVAVLLDLLLR